MPPEVSYRFLADCLHLAPVLAHWTVLEWNRDRLTETTYRDRVALYRRRTDPGRIPLTLIALDHDLPVGMITINAADLPARPDLAPWLASFYVAPEYRGTGIGSVLHDRIIAHAQSLGLTDLYLHTEKAARFYLARGWVFLDRAVDPSGRAVEVFRRRL